MFGVSFFGTGVFDVTPSTGTNWYRLLFGVG